MHILVILLSVLLDPFYSGFRKIPWHLECESLDAFVISTDDYSRVKLIYSSKAITNPNPLRINASMFNCGTWVQIKRRLARWNSGERQWLSDPRVVGLIPTRDNHLCDEYFCLFCPWVWICIYINPTPIVHTKLCLVLCGVVPYIYLSTQRKKYIAKFV